MSRASMAAAMTSGRAPVVGLSQYGHGAGQVDFEIGWPEFDRDLEWARRLLPAIGIKQGDTVLFTTRNAEGPWFSPLVRAMHDLGVVQTNAEPYNWDARRVAALLQLLPISAIVGLSQETAEALLADDGTAEALRKAPLVLARPEAAAALREGGLNPLVVAMLGPALGAECAARTGLHLDPAEWLPKRTVSGLTLDVVGERAHRAEGIVLDVDGRIDETPCQCGLPGPRIVLEGLD